LGASAALRGNDLIGLRHGGLGWLFDDHVLAGAKRLDGHLAVPASRSADRHHVDVNGLECLRQ
jgi:hypothetical protein